MGKRVRTFRRQHGQLALKQSDSKLPPSTPPIPHLEHCGMVLADSQAIYYPYFQKIRAFPLTRNPVPRDFPDRYERLAATSVAHRLLIPVLRILHGADWVRRAHRNTALRHNMEWTWCVEFHRLTVSTLS